jgi:hypothetical protein
MVVHPRGSGSGRHLRPSRFRTIQDCPKDLFVLIWQVERTGEPASNGEGHAMDERTTDRRSKKNASPYFAKLNAMQRGSKCVQG